MPAVESAEKAATLLKEVRVPDGFEASIFATPPAVNYPVFVAAAPDGTVYVSSDGNGSLDRKPHLGRILRVRDTNGDGQGDEVRVLVPDLDSPRGLVWDHDRLYVLHPPDISVFFDRDGDGVAEERKTLVKGIAFTFKDRPADHSSNGLELGVDGWLYAAIGDFGFLEAEGTDGKKLQLRGGGVVRVRPDGSGLEVWAHGTRNILEVAVSPLLDGFARDNTNDGGGWDVRLHHFSGLTQHGYPRLFKNFGDEIIQPLADYGGGSGCGAAWIDEPGFPGTWNNAPFTADWGRERVFRHGLTPNGATFAADQSEFLRLPRVTDLDVDAHSALYAASWKGASFTWVGPEVGYLVRVTPKGYQSPPLPDHARLTDLQLVAELASPSHRRRLEAQRTLIRRGLRKETADALAARAADTGVPTASRVAALFALKQASGTSAHPTLLRLLADESIAPWALRALGDRLDETRQLATEPIVAKLASANPVTRKEALITLARIGRTEASPRLFPALADKDPVVAHTALQALRSLQPVESAFAALDASLTPEAVWTGIVRVLQTSHQPAVVDGLIRRLAREKAPLRRQALLVALCRLHSREGTWKGDSWGTRPDTRGPWYQPEEWDASGRILETLQATVQAAGPEEAAFLGREMARHRIQSQSAVRKLIELAGRDPAVLPALASQLASAEQVPAEAVPALARAATDASTPDAARAQAIQALARTRSDEGWRALLKGLPLALATKSENHQAEKARSAFLNSGVMEEHTAVLASEAARTEGDSSLWADVGLFKVAARKNASPEHRAQAGQALDEGWKTPARRAQILRAAGIAGDATRATQFLQALDDADPAVAEAARKTVRQLKIDTTRTAASEPKVGDMPVDRVLAAVAELQGEAARGELLFTQLGCNSCHTVKTDEPLKGPFLGHIAKTYRRRELAEAILVPGKTLAQGFVAHHFDLKDGSELEGFVVEEAAYAVTIRTITSQEMKIRLTDITKREKLNKSLMPEGLVAGSSLREFASLLDYLQALAKSAP